MGMTVTVGAAVAWDQALLRVDRSSVLAMAAPAPDIELVMGLGGSSRVVIGEAGRVRDSAPGQVAGATGATITEGLLPFKTGDRFTFSTTGSGSSVDIGSGRAGVRASVCPAR